MNGTTIPRVPGMRGPNGQPLYDSGALSDGHSPRPLRSSSSLPPSHPQSIPSSSYGPNTPPIKRNTALSSRAPLPPSSSSHTIAVPTPSPLASSPSALRRVLPIIAIATVTLSFPLLYLLSSSSFLSSTLCSSLISSQAAVTMKSISLHNPSSSSSSLSPFTPILFPTPTPYLYITSYPDPAASLSQQFAQWLYGPYLALTLNISYTFTPFSKLSSRYTSFLGFGYSEPTEADLLSTFARSRIFIHKDDQRATTVIEDWIRDKRKKVDHINTQLTHYHTKRASFPDLPPPKLDEPKGSILDGYDTSQVDPSKPVTTVTVFRLYRVGVPSLMMACHPPLLTLLRRKYCGARVRMPMVDLYREDRQAGHMIVGVSLVCGEQCYTDKALPLTSTINTIQQLTKVAAKHSLPPPSFHIFTSPPSNSTSPPTSTSTYFTPLTSLPFTRLHLDLHSHLAFHHLVQSDVLVAPSLTSSSSSWLVQLLHHGVVVGPGVPQHACRGEVGLYNKETGGFDEDSFVQVWKEVGAHTQRYDQINDCATIT